MKKNQNFNVLAILGFIFSFTFVFSFIGIVLCIIALFQIRKSDQRGRGLAITGLVIGIFLPLLLIAALGLGAFAFYEANSVKGSGNVVSQDFDLTGFESITVSNGADLILTQGEAYSVIIEAEDNILELLEVEVGERGLNIGLEEFVFLQNTEPIKVKVTMPEVSTLTVEGSGSVVSNGRLSGDRIIVRIYGSGDVNVEVEVEEFNSRIIGSGDVNVRGTTREYIAIIEGSGDVNSLSLNAEDVEARISGSGSMMLFASKTLDINIEGSGNVMYKGEAKITKSISGSGDISKI